MSAGARSMPFVGQAIVDASRVRWIGSDLMRMPAASSFVRRSAKNVGSNTFAGLRRTR